MAPKRSLENAHSSEDNALTEDDTAESSSLVQTPPQGNKRARYSLVDSIPSDSPGNLFSNINEAALIAAREKEERRALVLPEPTVDYLELRFQLVRFKVWRVVQVPANYNFVILNQLCYFFFGWDDSHAHCFDVVKDVTKYSGNYKDGEIKESTKVVKVRPASAPKRAYDLDAPVRKEKDTMLNQVWGADGSKNSRGVIYNWDLGSPWTVHITIRKGLRKKSSNLPVILRGKGAPLREDPPIVPWTDEPEEDSDDKTFEKNQFNGDAFAKFIRGELVVDCGYDDIVVCTKEEREQRWKDDRQRIKDAARDVMSDYESSDEEEASIGRLEFPEDGDDDDDDA